MDIADLSYAPELFWTNFPEDFKPSPSNLGFLANSQLLVNFFVNLTKPTFIYAGTNYIRDLETAEYSQELIDKLNETGIDIYFYEPLCFRQLNLEHNRSYYTEFKDSSMHNVVCDELDSVEKFRIKNKIKDINIYATEYRINDLQKNYPNLKFNCFDIFLESINKARHFSIGNVTKKKKFWCANWRYTPHRHIITSYLINFEGVYSWHISCNFELLKNNSWFDLDKLETTDISKFIKVKLGADILENNVFSIDQHEETITVEDYTEVHIPGNISPQITKTFFESYADCFCAIVTETRFAQPFANISEKTINAFRAMLPIIIVGPPRSLEYLRSFGFKTFDRWWDESYDLEEDHEKRMLMIMDLIDYIDSKSIEELNVMYQEMYPILEYNEKVGCDKKNSTEVLYWTNFPDTHKPSSKNLGFLRTTMLRLGFFLNFTNPMIIYTGTGYIYQLEKLEYNQDTIDYLNNVGLSVYFYEPLSFRTAMDHNRSYYSEFKSDVSIESMRSDELDSVEYFVRANKLTNVNVYAGDYKIQLLQNKYPNLKLNCFDIFLRSLDHKMHFDTIKNTINKKFWCANWRYTPHRHIIMSYLVPLSGNYSWNISCSFDKLNDNEWFDINTFKHRDLLRYNRLQSGSEILENNPLYIDLQPEIKIVDSITQIHVPHLDDIPSTFEKFFESYAECFCAIVNETRFAQPFANVSEKTLHPMRAKIPLIIVAPPYSLLYLKTFGFKTFDRWWDESYDLEEDHEKRLLMIMDLIDYIDSKSIEELNVMYQEMSDVLDHNYKIVKSFKQINLNFTVL